MKCRSFFLLICFFTFSSCSDFNEKVPEAHNSLLNEIQGFKKTKNPYSLENMKKAAQNLLIQHSNLANELNPNAMTATHLYIKIIPQNEETLNQLKMMPDLELFEYPLDVELTEGEELSSDLKSNIEIPTQYVVVDVNFVFPNNIQYEILDELFQESFDSKSKNRTISKEMFSLIEEESNKLLKLEDSDVSLRSGDWNPSGTIRAYDDFLARFLPIEGAKVCARRWTTVHCDLTDANGYFETSSFKRKVNYSIKWETGEYDIREGYIYQAIYNGPKIKGAWNLDISSGKSIKFATVHRAAYRYHYKNIQGLKRPNIAAGPKLKIAYVHEAYAGAAGVCLGTNWQVATFQLIPSVIIWGENLNTRQLYAVTSHEIAHASHIEIFNFDEIQFLSVKNEIYESWATAVEFHLTKLEYSELGYDFPTFIEQTNDDNSDGLVGDDDKDGIPNYLDTEDFSSSSYDVNEEFLNWMVAFADQEYSEDDTSPYTPMFIDAIDGFNQSSKLCEVAENPCPYIGTYDSANCHVMTPPAESSAFIYNNNFYYTPVNENQCPNGGSFDGANCFVANIPTQTVPFIWNNMFYVSPEPESTCELLFDQIHGYNLSFIEANMLQYIKNVDDLKEWLKNYKPAGITDNHIDIYFEKYNF
jgi:hypothetical protein